MINISIYAAPQPPLRDPTKPAQGSDGSLISLTIVPKANTHDRRVAVIGGQTVSIGDTIDGYKVMTIKGNKVILQRGDKKKTLLISDRSAPGSGTIDIRISK